MSQHHQNELKQAIFQDENYLESHGMEWNNGNIRQRPGLKNPMGLVKFMFPNSNAIYLHDTPIKVYLNLITVHLVMGVSIWTKPRNCINSKRGPNWTVEAINEAMKGKNRPSISSRMKSLFYCGLTISIFFIMIYIKETIV
jgi:murein L,D-transpeptidase YcbB/YkuD